MSEIEAAIRNLNIVKLYGMNNELCNCGLWLKGVDLAIEALREKQAREDQPERRYRDDGARTD